MSEESTIHPSIKSTSDFSDKLSPMLVKELRQGLKGISFMILFIAIQVILAVLILGQSFSTSYDNVGQNLSTTVFVCVALATCVVQPLRAISAIGAEVKENTIDLMVITKLSAWRIVYGKWISLVSQTVLIIAAVTPYLILRYFFGGMQLFTELIILFTIFLASVSLTALFIGLSSIPIAILRGLIGVSCAFIIGWFSLYFFLAPFGVSPMYELCSFEEAESIYIYFMLVVCATYFSWLSLDFGAGRIAPISENRATPRRLICLGIIAILFIIFSLAPADFSQAAPGFMLILSLPLGIISLTEHSYTTPTVSVPFVKKGVLGRISSSFLYPGWASGLNFVLILFLLTLLSAFFYQPSHAYSFHSNYRQEMITISGICFSCLVFPLLLVRIFFKKSPQPFIFYLVGMIATSVIWLVVVIIEESVGSSDIYRMLCWIPPIQFNLFDQRSSEELAQVIAAPTFLIYWTACFILSRKSWALVRENDRQAVEIIKVDNQFNSSE